MQRRERTRHLIELGGLVQKAGLVDLTDDDRATILGGLLGCVSSRMPRWLKVQAVRSPASWGLSCGNWLSG